MCFETGVFPNCLKIAEVVPIFKKSDRSKATNYRPISLLSQFDKILEKTIYHRLIHFLEKYQLLNKVQFGFRQNPSTIQAISKIYDEIVQNIDQDLYTCCIFLDLSKAFDTVDHNILLEKLYHSFGIRGIPHELLRSYLTDRLQCTVVANAVSSERPVRCGIPQGSCLGPLLFLLYINDLPSASQLTIGFAKQIQHVDYWLRKNKLSLNYSKTNFLLINKHPQKKVDENFVIRLNDKLLERSSTVKYLGLLIDDTLNWFSHIYTAFVSSACSSLWNFLQIAQLC